MTAVIQSFSSFISESVSCWRTETWPIITGPNASPGHRVYQTCLHHTELLGIAELPDQEDCLLPPGSGQWAHRLASSWTVSNIFLLLQSDSDFHSFSWGSFESSWEKVVVAASGFSLHLPPAAFVNSFSQLHWWSACGWKRREHSCRAFRARPRPKAPPLKDWCNVPWFLQTDNPNQKAARCGIFLYLYNWVHSELCNDSSVTICAISRLCHQSEVL